MGFLCKKKGCAKKDEGCPAMDSAGLRIICAIGAFSCPKGAKKQKKCAAAAFDALAAGRK